MTLCSVLPARGRAVVGAVVAVAALAGSAAPAAAAPPPASVTTVDVVDATRASVDALAAAARVLVAAARPAPGSLVWPTDGEVTSEFGPREHPVSGGVRAHDGLDVGAPSGTPVVAAAPGRVVAAETQGGYGLLVVVDHGDGLETAAAHLSSVDVAVGDAVRAGDRLGAVGATGTATGPHLHLEVRVDGEAVDPREWLAPA